MILTYRGANDELFHQVGSLDGPFVFSPGQQGMKFDKGRRLAVATNSGAAVQIHQSQNENRLSRYERHLVFYLHHGDAIKSAWWSMARKTLQTMSRASRG